MKMRFICNKCKIFYSVMKIGKLNINKRCPENMMALVTFTEGVYTR